jgi:hypothetical protein
MPIICVYVMYILSLRDLVLQFDLFWWRGKYLFAFGNKRLEGATRWRIWLRHCTTSRKVAGSIPDGVIGIFH